MPMAAQLRQKRPTDTGDMERKANVFKYALMPGCFASLYDSVKSVGVDDGKVSPVPIPNTEVKLTCAEDS